MNTPPSKAHGNTGLRTVKMTPRKSAKIPWEVELEQLKAEVEAGVKYFYDRRPELARPAAGRMPSHFSQRA